MSVNLAKVAKQKKIKYFLISYVDFFGVLRSKLVPAQSISKMQKEGTLDKIDKYEIIFTEKEIPTSHRKRITNIS